jgi:thiol:disulfide interchange protein DsbC
MLRACPADQSRVEAQVKLASSAVITGTPMLMIGGKLISDFQQAEIEASLYSETMVDAKH